MISWRKTFGALVIALLFVIFVLPVLSADADAVTPEEDLRGVWVSTVLNLDYPAQGTTDAAALRQEIDEILDRVVDLGFNAVFFQVRPSADSCYPSEIFPWSRYLTGKQGLAPSDDFDPLAYWVQQAHQRGVELHAWLNPYRITKYGATEYAALAANHPALLHPDWVIQHTDGNYYFDPALPEVRQLVIDGALEIVEHYDVDGIHLDDYFYPGSDFPDDASYARYGGGFANKADWRRDNVNQLIQDLDQALHQADAGISFGVSPAGVWENKSSNPAGSDTQGGNPSYSKVFADSRKWAQEGWVDYIAPQIYWEIGHAQADYKTLVNWWADVVADSDTKLYIGMASYKSATLATDSVWYGSSEILRQLQFNDTVSEVDGEILFRYGLLEDTPGMDGMLQQYYGGNTAQQPNGGSDSDIVFQDLGGAKWAEEYIYRLAELGVVNGVGQYQFAPAAQVKRSEYLKMLLLALDIEIDHSARTSYEDVPTNQWYYSYIATAEDLGIVPAAGGRFQPAVNITREDMAIFAANALTSAGITIPAPAETLTFTDESSISAKGKDAVQLLAQAGIINGYEDGSFRPQGLATRAEASKIIYLLRVLYEQALPAAS